MKTQLGGGVHRIIGLLIAGGGVGLIVASFAVWGRVRTVRTDNGALESSTVSFPGLGQPSITGTYSEGNTSATVNVSIPPTLHNTNPGWISLVLGIVAIIAGIAYVWLRHRRIVAIAVAILGATSGLYCIGHILDVRGTFNDPPDLAAVKFSPGAGLVASCVLSFALVAAGITAFIVEWRAPSKNALH